MTGEETMGAPQRPAVTFATVAALFGRLVGLALLLGIAVGLLLTAAAVALPAPAVEPSAPFRAASGRFLVRRAHGEPWVTVPTLATEARFRVAGVLARASVRQRFRNGTDECVEGMYVFPLPENAAVDHLLMRVGERTFEGQIRERAQAKAEHQHARDGRRASPVEQERPNVLTTNVADLAPGEELVVEIELQQRLALDEGEVRLRFPLVVGPRYVPGQEIVEAVNGLGRAADRDAVADASPVTPPLLASGEVARNPAAIEVDLDAGFPGRPPVSRYHAVVSEGKGEGRYHVRLRDELVPAGRDFELAGRPEPGTMPRVTVDIGAAPNSQFMTKAAAVPTQLPQGWVHGSVLGELPQTATAAPFHALVAFLWLLAIAALRLAAKAPRRGRRS